MFCCIRSLCCSVIKSFFRYCKTAFIFRLNQSALLPYLTSNLAALKGMVLFPKSNPDSRLEDISDGTFRLRIVNRDGSITQRLKWSDIRREEGEDAIVVTLINSPQMQKLSADFREFLFVRALFYGVKPEALRARYDRASGLPAEKRDELYRTADTGTRPPGMDGGVRDRG